MSLEQVLNDVQNRVPDCVASGMVDISTGMLLAVRTVDNHPSEILDMLAAATGDLFRGKNVVQIEEMWNRVRGTSGASYFKEIVVFSDHFLHIFIRSSRNPSHVGSFVCRTSVQVGMALHQSREAMKALEEAL